MTRLPFANDFCAAETVPETSRKAVTAWAEGAKTETESKLLTALRRQRFGSAGSLASFVKIDDAEVRDALTDLIARKLVHWADESISSSGAGYRAVDFKGPAQDRSTKSSNLRDRLGFR